MKLKLNKFINNKNIIKKVDYILLPYEDINSNKLLDTIKNFNSNIKIGIELNTIKKIDVDNIDFIQTSNIETIKYFLLQNKYELFYKTKVDCDEDINWSIPDGYEEILKKVNIEIELLYGIKENKRLKMFIEECGKYEEDITSQEIDEFCTLYNCFIYFPIKNLNEVKILKNLFSNLKGFSFNFLTQSTSPKV